MAGRTKKSENVEEPLTEVIESEETTNVNTKVEEEIPAYADAAMKLYPQYQELWVSPKGHVHPKAASAYVTEDAVLYTNKYFNN